MQVSERHGQRQRSLTGENLNDKTCLDRKRRMHQHIEGIFQDGVGERHLLLNDLIVTDVSRITQQGYALVGRRTSSPPLTTMLSLLSIPSSFAGFALATFAASISRATLAGDRPIQSSVGPSAVWVQKYASVELND